MALVGDWRWISDGPADGPVNMARDEAILLSVSEGGAPPTLRFYRWSPPTVSLGYFQSYSDYAALPPPAGGLPVVRRLTGGGAILHDLELTYSLVLPSNHPLLPACGAAGLYDVVHDAFARFLTNLGVSVIKGPSASGGASHRGPFFCFDRHNRFDLLTDGRKIMGSAQRRLRTAILQHGSLILDNRFQQQCCASVAEYAPVVINTWLPRLVEEITRAPAGKPAKLSNGELETAERLVFKYRDEQWTRRR
ncbi:MAG TPA: lipoate--protein ligase family protein [Phycisphaerae bacterium]|nr:lipoate--protein ligase family protein [Phycisphaerae bacterium]HRR84092.1 lipoate--protein ligase family protein [Phycisphaerae bacterium]